MSEEIRSFIAIEIPEEIRNRIGELQKRLRDCDCQVSWVKPSNIHLTLKFLGQVPLNRIEKVAAAVEAGCAGAVSFELEVAGAGSFPPKRNPKVLWAGLGGSGMESLTLLQSRIDKELAKRGFSGESKPFNPHLTIGRVRSPKNTSILLDELASNQFQAASFIVNEVILMRSELNPAGSIYTPLARVALD